MKNSNIKKEVKSVIINSLELDIAPDEMDDNDPLFGEGLGGNSMALVEVIVGLEKAFEIEISDEELIMDVFETVNSIAEFIKSKVS